MVFFVSFLGAKKCYFEGWGQVQIVLWSIHIVQQLIFSMFPSVLTFDFGLILGLFLTFWGPIGLFFGFNVGLKNCFSFHSCS